MGKRLEEELIMETAGSSHRVPEGQQGGDAEAKGRLLQEVSEGSRKMKPESLPLGLVI